MKRIILISLLVLVIAILNGCNQTDTEVDNTIHQRVIEKLESGPVFILSIEEEAYYINILHKVEQKQELSDKEKEIKNYIYNSNMFFPKSEPKEEYLSNSLYCESNSDCRFLMTCCETPCNCLEVVNYHNWKKVECDPPLVDFRLNKCLSGVFKCITNECQFIKDEQ